MEDMENSGVVGIGSGIILTCENEKKYIGFLQGTDDTYLYLKVTHQWGERAVEVTEESSQKLRHILEARPLWSLKAEIAWKLRIVPLGMTKKIAVELLADYLEAEAIESAGPQFTFLPEPKAVNMGVPHYKIDTFESLQDVVSGTVLSDLDFEGIMEEMDDLEDEEDDEEFDDEDEDSED